MVMHWGAYRDQINATIEEIRTANPKIVKAYGALHWANSNSKLLDAKTRELIALAVAVTLRCDGCINAHADAGIKAGASKDEIV